MRTRWTQWSCLPYVTVYMYTHVQCTFWFSGMDLFENIELTSTTELWFSLNLFPISTGFPSTNIGLLPSFEMKNSPLASNLMTPCLRLILLDGPSSDRSTSTVLFLACRPRVICIINNTYYKFWTWGRICYAAWIWWHLPPVISSDIELVDPVKLQGYDCQDLEDWFLQHNKDYKIIIQIKIYYYLKLFDVVLRKLPVMLSTVTFHLGISFSKWRISFFILRSTIAISGMQRIKAIRVQWFSILKHGCGKHFLSKQQYWNSKY